MLHTTVGQLLVNEALPPEMRDYTRVMDKATTRTLMKRLSQRSPEVYRETLKRLMNVGRDVAYREGSMSFGLADLLPTRSVQISRKRLNRRIRDVLTNPEWPDAVKMEKILTAASEENDRLLDDVLKDAEAAKNPLALQVRSGARGSPSQLKRLIGGDMLYLDHREQPIATPVQTSFSEGLSPAEYWASAYGARKGLVDTKLSTQRAGSVAKQFNQAAHRLMVTAIDDEKEDRGRKRGFPVETRDPDAEFGRIKFALKTYPEIRFRANPVKSGVFVDEISSPKPLEGYSVGGSDPLRSLFVDCLQSGGRGPVQSGRLGLRNQGMRACLYQTGGRAIRYGEQGFVGIAASRRAASYRPTGASPVNVNTPSRPTVRGGSSSASLA